MPFTSELRNLWKYEQIDSIQYESPNYWCDGGEGQPDWVDIQTSNIGSKLPISQRMFLNVYLQVISTLNKTF